MRHVIPIGDTVGTDDLVMQAARSAGLSVGGQVPQNLRLKYIKRLQWFVKKSIRPRSKAQPTRVVIRADTENHPDPG
jgi:hypothetical protein